MSDTKFEQMLHEHLRFRPLLIQFFSKPVNHIHRLLIGQSKRAVLGCSVAIVLVYLLPYVLLGTKSHITIHDNLDSHQALFSILKESGQMRAGPFAIVKPIMGGIPRYCFRSEFNLLSLIYILFSPFVAYVVNAFVSRGLAFVGMALLLNRYRNHASGEDIAVYGTAVCFSVLPFWAPGGSSVSILPFALWAFLKVRDNSRDWFAITVCLLVPFLSLFFLVGLFFLVFCAGVEVLRSIQSRKLRILPWLILIIQLGTWCLIEYRMFYVMMFSHLGVLHRSEMAIQESTSLALSIKRAFQLMLSSQYHAQTLHNPICIVTVIASSALIVKMSRIELRRYRLIAFSIIAICFFAAFWMWNPVFHVRSALSLLNSFNVTRFTMLLPLLWYLLFGLSLLIINRYVRHGAVIITVLLLTQIFLFEFTRHEEIVNRRRGHPSYAEFFSSDLFERMKDIVGKNEKVACVGFHPSIALINGLSTVDGYISAYPLSYKHKFLEMMKPELQRSPWLKAYFNKWGSRCYLFSSEINGNVIEFKSYNHTIDSLNVDCTKLVELGCKFLLSTTPIATLCNSNCVPQNILTSNSSAFTIYVYDLDKQLYSSHTAKR